MNLCIVNEDHPQCNVPRKAIKACPGRGRAFLGALSGPHTLSHLESGHVVPFSLQDFCSLCIFVYCSHNTGSCWPGSTSLGSLQWTLLCSWKFLPSLQPPQVFSDRGFEPLVPHTGILGCVVCLTPQLFLPVHPHAHVGLPSPPATILLWVLSALAACLHPSYLSGWMFLL